MARGQRPKIPPNPMAKSLRNPMWSQRVVQSKKRKIKRGKPVDDITDYTGKK